MQYPVRPQIPNPYQIAGQAAQQLGGQVQQYGKDRDELAERFRLMMEKRAQTELQKQQLTAEQDLKLSNEKRQQSEFETKQKSEKESQEFLAGMEGADMADPAVQMRLKQGLMRGVITPEVYKAFQPEKVTQPGKVQEYEYAKANGFTGSFTDFVNPPKPQGDDKPTRGQIMLNANGIMVSVDPVTNVATPVKMADGSSVLGKGGSSIADLEAKASNSLSVLDQMVGSGTPGSPDYKPPHPGFSSVVGFGKGPGMLFGAKSEPVSGTQAADFKALLDQVQGVAFLQAFNDLKGAGQITEIEGQKATNAISRLRSSLTEDGFMSAANELKGIIRNGLQRAKQARAGTPQAQPQGQAAGNIVDVQTPDQARSLPPGTRFRTPDGRVKVR